MPDCNWQHAWSDREVEEHWDRVAHMYVDENDKVQDAHDQRFRVALEHMSLSAGMKLLNITSRDCGAVPAIEQACEGIEIINAEISRGLIEVAEKLHPQVIQHKIDTYSDLPYADKEFDIILSLETLEHVSQPTAFLAELFRVCKPGGRLVMSCPPATSELSYQLYTKFFGGHGEGPHQFPPSKRVKKWLQASGWGLTHHQGTLLFPVGPKWARAWGEWLLRLFHWTPLSEMGIRQFYVCDK